MIAQIYNHPFDLMFYPKIKLVLKLHGSTFAQRCMYVCVCVCAPIVYVYVYIDGRPRGGKL